MHKYIFLLLFFVPELAGMSADKQAQCQQMVQVNDAAALLHLLGNDVNQAIWEEEGFTALYFAASGGHYDIVKALLTNKANTEKTPPGNTSPLIVAAHEGYTEVVTLLLAHGAHVNYQADQIGGWSPLLCASAKNKGEVVEILLTHGAQINQVEKGGYTPLMVAANNGHGEVVKILLAHGADKTIKNNDGKTALDLAQEQLASEKLENPEKYYEIINMLSTKVPIARLPRTGQKGRLYA